MDPQSTKPLGALRKRRTRWVAIEPPDPSDFVQILDDSIPPVGELAIDASAGEAEAERTEPNPAARGETWLDALTARATEGAEPEREVDED